MNKKQMVKVAEKLGVKVADVNSVMSTVTTKNPNYNTMRADIKNSIGYYYLIDIKTSELKKYHNGIIKNFIEKHQGDYDTDTKSFKSSENILAHMELVKAKNKALDGCSDKQGELSEIVEKCMDTLYKRYSEYLENLRNKDTKTLYTNCYEYQVAKFFNAIGVTPTTLLIDAFVRSLGGVSKSASVEKSDTFVAMNKNKFIKTVVCYIAQLLIDKNLIKVDVLKENTDYVAKIKDAKIKDIAEEVQEILDILD